MKKILLYGIDDQTADSYQTLASNSDIAAYIIGDSVLEEPLDKLFDIQDDLDNVHCEYADEYMLMQEIEVSQLLTLLRQFSAAKLPFEGIKVMRTRENSSWTLRHLLEEASREQAVSKKVIILQELIKSCNGLDVSSMDARQQREFKNSLMEGYLLLKSGEYTEEALDEKISALTQQLRNTRKLYN